MKVVEVAVLMITVIALGCAAIFLPAIELIPAQAEPGFIGPGLSPVRSPGIMESMKDVGGTVSEWFGGTKDLKVYVEGDPKSTKEPPGELKVYAMWAVFLSVAMTLAAVALSLIGRYDSEEKTILPVKK